MKQQLVICLDGTWNNRDSSTNVLHHYVLALDGEFNGVYQRTYYHSGVGTGVLDKVSGGAFGIGLEEHVREAYNWLVQHYNGASRGRDGNEIPADDIFIFGFSRGAYTARSLVGFIATCGLLKRGAPLTVEQLWKNYQLHGRSREQHAGWAELLLPIEEPEFRRLGDIPPGAPGSTADTLLSAWSDRVPIRFLGIYDTVGAMGLDALAIPYLTSAAAGMHNMRPTTLLQSCRHALAIDEHRANFKHTSLMRYAGDENAQEAMTDWSKKIEQRWFAGAHANIGGGYANNELAAEPFKWLDAEAQTAGLKPRNAAPAYMHCIIPIKINDSYTEFMRGCWAYVIRSKRNFRRINPPPEYRAIAPQNRKRTGRLTGIALVAIHEEIDISVQGNQCLSYKHPPNLYEYYVRHQMAQQALGHVIQLPFQEPTLAGFPWLEKTLKPNAFLICWATLAAVGFNAVKWLITDNSHLRWWWLCVAAVAFTICDWGEHRQNFKQALAPDRPGWRAWLDGIYWMRMFGVMLGVAGFIFGLCHFGWTAWYGTWGNIAGEVGKWLGISGCAAGTAVICILIDTGGSHE